VSPLGWSVSLVLGAWLLLTIVRQVPRASAALARRDPLGVLPIWTFFAPRPGDADHHVVFRDFLPDGEATEWTPLRLPRSGRWRALWKPSKRVEKLVTDCAPSVVHEAVDLGDAHRLGIPYLLIAGLVESAPHDFRAAATQFAIVDVRRALTSAPQREAIYISTRWNLA
jgi:hypothetical protein